MSEVMQAQPLPFSDTLKGFAAMCRTGALDATDGEMLAAKFDAAANEIERLQSTLREIARETSDMLALARETLK
jgi:hypothetical protein